MSKNPSFYVTVFSSMCFIASEMMPFLPTESNGIVHGMCTVLKDFNNRKSEPNDECKKINERIDRIMDAIRKY